MKYMIIYVGISTKFVSVREFEFYLFFLLIKFFTMIILFIAK